MLLAQIVLALIVAALLAKAVTRLLAPNHLRVIIITSHNNAILGFLQGLLEAVLPKTVLPNGSVLRLEVSSFWITVSIITPDEEHPKFLKKEHVTTLFSIPIPFPCADCLIYLVRHGESEANTGVNFINPSLTQKGYEDAKKAGEAIMADLKKMRKKFSVTCISSPLKRAVQTMAAIKKVLGISKRTILDAMLIETVRDMGRPIHTRGPKANPATITACDPHRSFDSYRTDHICNPNIKWIDLWKLVVPNIIPSNLHRFKDKDGSLIDVDSSLLEDQLATDEWPSLAAMTPLYKIVASHI
jgi:broad specificity phosphatase PhoE